MRRDQPTNSRPAGLTGPALPARVELSQPRAPATLAAPIHRPHPTQLVGVLAAPAVGELGRSPLAVLAVAGQAAAAFVELLGPLDVCAGRAALEGKPRRVG